MKLKARYIPEKNYFSLFINDRKTVRFQVDDDKPIQKLPWDNAEMYDLAINNKCYGGCDYCYISALPTGTNYEGIVEKVHRLFTQPVKFARQEMVRNALVEYLGSESAVQFVLDMEGFDITTVPLTDNPFQVAIGGAGEPTNHPEFAEFLLAVKDNNVVPNFTTNGMRVPESVLQACDEVVGGVSVTLHPHLEKHWRNALELYAETKAQLHAHVVIYDAESITTLTKYIEEYPDVTMVLLPFQHVGFGETLPKVSLDFYDKLFDTIVGRGWANNVAYGAGFHSYLSKRNPVRASLYEPHDFSYYIDLKGNGTVFRTSFEWKTPLKKGIFNEAT